MLLSVGGGVTLRGRDKYIQKDRGRETASALQPQREGEGDDETQGALQQRDESTSLPPTCPPLSHFSSFICGSSFFLASLSVAGVSFGFVQRSSTCCFFYDVI